MIKQVYHANRGVQANEKKTQENDDLQYTADLQWCLRNPAGRRLLYRLIFSICRVESQSFGGNVEETNFNEGRRSVGIALMLDLQMKQTDLYLVMLKEQITRNVQLLKLRDEKRVTVITEDEEDENA